MGEQESTGKGNLTTGNIIDGKWIVMERIGKGGMGEVFRAHQLNLKRDVAVKVISEEMLDSLSDDSEETETILSRFQREVQTMAQVRHQNILQIYDYGTIRSYSGDRPRRREYIVMEYIPGNTLRYTMSEQGFENEIEMTEEWSKKYFLPVLDGVEVIHSHGIAHRDMKPENVLMDGETPKIADFGLARSQKMRAISNSWEIKVTVAYMAPEQFNDFRKTGPPADIYALGKILFEAVEGKIDPAKTIPFKSAALSDPQGPFMEKIDGVVRTATRENKEERFRDVSSFRDGIVEALEILSEKRRKKEISVPLPPRIRGEDGIPAVLVPETSAGTDAAEPQNVSPGPFYVDEKPVAFRNYVDFLNDVAYRLTVKDGVVRQGEDIWLYMGSGDAPYEQRHSRFDTPDVSMGGFSRRRVPLRKGDFPVKSRRDCRARETVSSRA